MNHLKKEYIQHRNLRQMPITFIYDYARYKGLNVSFDDFYNTMSFIPFNVDEFNINLDKEFALTLMYAKDGKFLQVVE